MCSSKGFLVLIDGEWKRSYFGLSANSFLIACNPSAHSAAASHCEILRTLIPSSKYCVQWIVCPRSVKRGCSSYVECFWFSVLADGDWKQSPVRLSAAQRKPMHVLLHVIQVPSSYSAAACRCKTFSTLVLDCPRNKGSWKRSLMSLFGISTRQINALLTICNPSA